MLSGVCKLCGCTDLKPCTIDLANDVFCAWATPEEDLCTACMPQLDEAELIELADHEASVMTSAGFMLGLPLTPVEAVSLCSLLQLAGRHPDLNSAAPQVAEYCQHFIDAIAESLGALPAIGEMIRRGANPAFELKAAKPAEPASRLILPT